MQSIKNISERNKIDTQSRADTYIRRKRLIQCCGSGMFIPDPDFYPSPDPGSRIPDPKTATKERGEKKFLS
jgi:hypothetical protein